MYDSTGNGNLRGSSLCDRDDFIYLFRSVMVLVLLTLAIANEIIVPPSS